jgi:hypothetical protein
MEIPTTEQIQSWKDLKVEICMYIRPKEPFWLVPAYTNKDRVEISIDDFVKLAPTIAKVLEAFPDSKIATIIKPKERT